MYYYVHIIIFQFLIEASDQSEPPRTTTANVLIRFNKDMDPIFENMPREERVSENTSNDTVVFQARGRDDDKQV